MTSLLFWDVTQHRLVSSHKSEDLSGVIQDLSGVIPPLPPLSTVHKYSLPLEINADVLQIYSRYHSARCRYHKTCQECIVT
jgi:hypothetical protein